MSNGFSEQSPTREELQGDLDRVRKLYYELIYAVSTKYEGEERHETALRYIRQAESGSGSVCEQSPK